MTPPEPEDPQGLRTTLTIPADLLDQIDDLLHQGRRSGALPRSLKRNPFIIQLLRERVDQLTAKKSSSPSSSSAAKRK
jgi:hypothetical protein